MSLIVFDDPLNELDASEPALVLEIHTSNAALRDVSSALSEARENLGMLDSPLLGVIETAGGGWDLVAAGRVARAKARVARRLAAASRALGRHVRPARRLARLGVYADPAAVEVATAEALLALKALARLEAEPLPRAALKFQGRGRIEIRRGPQRPSPNRGVEAILVQDLMDAGLKRGLARRVSAAWLSILTRHTIPD